MSGPYTWVRLWQNARCTARERLIRPETQTRPSWGLCCGTAPAVLR